jgi:hypothetical protein
MLIRNCISTLALTGMFLTAHGQFPEWVAATSACVPDEAAVGGSAMTDARFHFAVGPVGSIETRCNVTNPRDNNVNPGWMRMEITQSDPDGMGAATQVFAQLMGVNKFTGATFVIATYDSNNFPAMPLLKSIPFGYAFNFINEAYFVRVRLFRNNAAANPWVARVRLYRD